MHNKISAALLASKAVTSTSSAQVRSLLHVNSQQAASSSTPSESRALLRLAPHTRLYTTHPHPSRVASPTELVLRSRRRSLSSRFVPQQPERLGVSIAVQLHTRARNQRLRLEDDSHSITASAEQEHSAVLDYLPPTKLLLPANPAQRPRRNSFDIASVASEPDDFTSAASIEEAVEAESTEPSSLGSAPLSPGSFEPIHEWNNKIISLFQAEQPADALGLLESMLDGEAPRPDASTYTAIIQGFCDSGDLTSALKWFERLLTQPATKYAPRPDREAWSTVLRSLAAKGEITTLNKLFPVLVSPESTVAVEAADLELIVDANTKYFSSTSESGLSTLINHLQFMSTSPSFVSILPALSFTSEKLRNLVVSQGQTTTTSEPEPQVDLVPEPAATFTTAETALPTDSIQELPSLAQPSAEAATPISSYSTSPEPYYPSPTEFAPAPVAEYGYYATPVFPQVAISAQLSRTLDDLLHAPTPRPSQINQAYTLLLSHSASSTYPTPETLGRLINSLGRLHDVPKLQSVYSTAQTVLYSLYADQERQRLSWLHIEDQMVEAYAHANDLPSSAYHRNRILEMGGVPSADAYGAVISSIKDTTDDATLALDVFHEALRVGTKPNTFLYNTIISKLSRARKAKHVLTLFQRMLEESISPSSVTYGAVICACCRVGDGENASRLFEKMVEMKNFKPQATPYNTMMQYYVQIEPNREKVLYYYDALRKAGVRPTGHTYKLLIDAYGTIEPVNTELMESTFSTLLSDPSVQLQGSHWASLLNAYGSVLKDLPRALSIFSSIPAPPDPIVWETMINVYISNHRAADLLPTFVEKMKIDGVRMTAYIANALIKGYASSGEIGRARDVFDYMRDPPRGVAAVFNRSVHEGEERRSVPQGFPVYREPSTWEAMVRAELGAGERARAVDLLDRMRERMFPEALTSRIRRIVYQDEVPLTEFVEHDI